MPADDRLAASLDGCEAVIHALEARLRRGGIDAASELAIREFVACCRARRDVPALVVLALGAPLYN